jgi:hypothetical protein
MICLQFYRVKGEMFVPALAQLPGTRAANGRTSGLAKGIAATVARVPAWVETEKLEKCNNIKYGWRRTQSISNLSLPAFLGNAGRF